MREHVRFAPQGEEQNQEKSSEKVYDWKEDGFDLKERLDSLDGPFIEIAGPTTLGFKTIDVSTLKKKVHVSNIAPGAPIFDRTTGEFKGHIGKIDFRADARRLPFADETVGAVFCSCLSTIYGEHGPSSPIVATRELRRKFLKEASRVLHKGGFLIWEGVKTEDVLQAPTFGFVLRQLRTFENPGEHPRKDMVLEKSEQEK